MVSSFDRSVGPARSSPDTAPSATSYKSVEEEQFVHHAGGTSEWKKVILRMQSSGIRTSDIAVMLDIQEDEVVHALVNQGSAGCPEAIGYDSGGCDLLQGEEATSRRDLVTRLLTDPRELCCPIHLSLMDDPVVAEDGYTYEREAIDASFAVRAQSPMTNLSIGPQVFPNQAIRSQILDYKEKIVEEILSVAPHLPGDDAAKLLQRAEGFTKPHLPDNGARQKLLALLQMRSQLPPEARGDALKELVILQASSSDDSSLLEFLEGSERQGLYAVLPDLDESILERMSQVWWQGTKVSPAILSKAAFATELSRRFASRAGKDLHAAKALWDLCVRWSNDPLLENWIDASALVLAACKMPEYDDADFSIVSKRIIERAFWFLRNPSNADTRSLELFGSILERNVNKRFITAFTYFHLARRQDAETEETRLLIEVRKVNRTFREDVVSRRLIELLSNALSSGHDVDERLLLKLICQKNYRNDVPLEVFSKLRLKDPVHVRSLEYHELSFLYQQLMKAGRRRDASRVAVIEATELEDSGDDLNFVREAYARAYRADRKNESALQGVVTSLLGVCSELEDRNNYLEATVKKMTDQIDQPATGATMSWDVSAMNMSSMKKNDSWRSSKFSLLGSNVKASLLFYPLGEEKFQAGETFLFTSLYLLVHKSCAVEFSLRIDDGPPLRLTVPEGKPGVGSHAFCPVQKKYSKIIAVIHKVEVRASDRISGNGVLTRIF
jgi:hypothetical protein